MLSKCKCSEHQLYQVGCDCRPIDVGYFDLSGEGLWVVQVEFENGSRYVHERSFDHKVGARDLAEKVREAGQINLEHWVAHNPRYGSEAFEAQEAEAVAYVPMLQRGWIDEADVPREQATLL